MSRSTDAGLADTGLRGAVVIVRESPVRSVVNVSSSSGTLRRVGRSVYGMTKCALDYLTQTLAGRRGHPARRGAGHRL